MLFFFISVFGIIGTIFLTAAQRSEPSPFLMMPFIIIFPLHFLIMVVVVLNLIYGIVNAKNNAVHTEDEKIIWIILMVVFNALVVPIYHFKYLRPTYNK